MISCRIDYYFILLSYCLFFPVSDKGKFQTEPLLFVPVDWKLLLRELQDNRTMK